MTSLPPSGSGINFSELAGVLSKIDHLETMPANPHSFLADFPHFCWRLGSNGYTPFSKISYLLTQFQGETDWFLIGDLPRVCMFAQPKEGLEAPTTDLEFLKKVQADVARLAAFLDDQLGTHAQPSLGFSLKEPDTDSEGDDYFDPDSVRSFLLAYDPARLKEEGIPTSEWDRALHYGLTLNEIGAINRDIDRVKHEQSKDTFSMLPTLSNPYATVSIPNEDLPKLHDECTRLSRDASPDTLAGIRKVRSALLSAQKHLLGILVRGQ